MGRSPGSERVSQHGENSGKATQITGCSLAPWLDFAIAPFSALRYVSRLGGDAFPKALSLLVVKLAGSW